MHVCGHQTPALTAIQKTRQKLIQELHLAMLQAHDLLDVLDLRVVDDLGQVGLPHVQQLTPAHNVRQSDILWRDVKPLQGDC